MKIYLAARYSRNAEMRAHRAVIEAYGDEVTSRWIDLHDGKYPGSFTREQVNHDPDYCSAIGLDDLDDIRSAEVVISFTEADGGGKGGRHVEFGIGYGLGKRMVLVGPREHVFHTLPSIEWYPDWATFCTKWGYREAGS